MLLLFPLFRLFVRALFLIPTFSFSSLLPCLSSSPSSPDDSAHFAQPNASNKTSHLVHSTNNFGGLSGHNQSAQSAAAAAAQQLQQQHQSAQQHHAAFNHNPNVSSKKDSRFVRQSYNCLPTLFSLPEPFVSSTFLNPLLLVTNVCLLSTFLFPFPSLSVSAFFPHLCPHYHLPFFP